MQTRPLYTIAYEIRQDWKNVNYAAAPYLNAMADMVSINDTYGHDSAHMVVRYFLANASSWRGEKAREIKAELRAMLPK